MHHEKAVGRYVIASYVWQHGGSKVTGCLIK